MKCKQLHPWFEMGSPNPFPMTISITPWVLPQLTASTAKPNIEIVCMQDQRYHHNELDLKYHDMGNEWTFVLASAWKNSVNAPIGGVRMLLSLHMCAIFNGNCWTAIISCYSLPNANNEINITTFYMLSSLVQHIPKHNILIIGRDLNEQISKNE